MIRKGGSYVREEDGTLRQVVPPTPDHPQGNAPRDAEGRRLDRPAPVKPGDDKAGAKAVAPGKGKGDGR